MKVKMRRVNVNVGTLGGRSRSRGEENKWRRLERERERVEAMDLPPL